MNHGTKGIGGILWLFQRSLPYYVKWSYIHHHDDRFSEFTGNGVTSGRAGVMGLWALNRVLYCCLCTNYPLALNTLTRALINKVVIRVRVLYMAGNVFYFVPISVPTRDGIYVRDQEISLRIFLSHI